MLTQTIINRPCLCLASGRLTELITGYCSIYPSVPCTIQLPNTRLLFFLAKLAVAACHVLQVFPGQLGLLLRVPVLHPASCSGWMEALAEPAPSVLHLLDVTAQSSSAGIFGCSGAK